MYKKKRGPESDTFTESKAMALRREYPVGSQIQLTGDYAGRKGEVIGYAEADYAARYDKSGQIPVEFRTDPDKDLSKVTQPVLVVQLEGEEKFRCLVSRDRKVVSSYPVGSVISDQ
ncbi:MAG: hypothetical protein ABIG66_04915 [Candidatus Kerfeldbacteria bacterium]